MVARTSICTNRTERPHAERRTLLLLLLSDVLLSWVVVLVVMVGGPPFKEVNSRETKRCCGKTKHSQTSIYFVLIGQRELNVAHKRQWHNLDGTKNGKKEEERVLVWPTLCLVDTFNYMSFTTTAARFICPRSGLVCLTQTRSQLHGTFIFKRINQSAAVTAAAAGT